MVRGIFSATKYFKDEEEEVHECRLQVSRFNPLPFRGQTEHQHTTFEKHEYTNTPLGAAEEIRALIGLLLCTF